MDRVNVALLRGVCQSPAYVAQEMRFFEEEGIEARIRVQPTAWVVPSQLMEGAVQFAVIPWTRVAAASSRDEGLVLICGSGCEEAALVVRTGIELDEIETLAVPQEGGIKDLTAGALVRTLNLSPRTTLRMPSGDGAILAMVGQAADAASMVEPYAAMLEDLGIGRVVKRTGDVWPGAPGCSLTTGRNLLENNPDLVRRFVSAFARGARFVSEDPETSATISARYIGVHERIVGQALRANRPNIDALMNEDAMNGVLDLMMDLGYIRRRPQDFCDLSYLPAMAR
jgi:NitT/TauT family transport system substrate-binding protein